VKAESKMDKKSGLFPRTKTWKGVVLLSRQKARSSFRECTDFAQLPWPCVLHGQKCMDRVRTWNPTFV